MNDLHVSVEQKEEQYAWCEVSNRSKVDNSLAKMCKKVRTRAESGGVAFAKRIWIQMQMSRFGGGKMRKFSCYFCFRNELRSNMISQK